MRGGSSRRRPRKRGRKHEKHERENEKIEGFSTTDSTEGHGKWGSAFRLDSRWVISRATDALVDAEQILP